MQNGSIPSALSFPRVIWALIRHPTRAFTNITNDPNRSWLFLAILLMLLIALSGFLNQNLLMNRQAEPNQAAMPAVLLSIGSSLMIWLKWLVWAGLIFLTSTLLGGNSNFKSLWRVVAWSSLPDLVRSLLQSIFLLLTRQPIEYAGLSGLILRGAENPTSSQLALAGILGQIDLFAIWRLILLVIGVVCATGLVRRKALIVILIVWVILTALGLIPTQISSFVNSSIS